MDQTISGAVCTGLHGSGIHHGLFGSYLQSIEVLDSYGEHHYCSITEDTDLFHAQQLSLGALGIITCMEVEIYPMFHLKEIQYPMLYSDLFPNSTSTSTSPTFIQSTTSPISIQLDSKLDRKLSNKSDEKIDEDIKREVRIKEKNGKIYDEILKSDHFRCFYFPYTNRIWATHILASKDPVSVSSRTCWSRIRTRIDDFIGHQILESLYYLSGYFPNSLSPVPHVNKFYRHYFFNQNTLRCDKSYKILTFDCLFKQYVNEWCIPIDAVEEALTKLKEIQGSADVTAHFPIEIRFTSGDDIWLSPSYQRDSAWIGIIMYRPFGKDIPYKSYFKKYEQLMHSLGGRPHWAKAFNLETELLSAKYPRWKDWLRVRQRMDPHHLFINSFLSRVLDISINPS